MHHNLSYARSQSLGVQSTGQGPSASLGPVGDAPVHQAQTQRHDQDRIEAAKIAPDAQWEIQRSVSRAAWAVVEGLKNDGVFRKFVNKGVVRTDAAVQVSLDEVPQLQDQLCSLRTELEEHRRREAVWCEEKTSLQTRIQTAEIALEQQRRQRLVAEEVMSLPSNSSVSSHAMSNLTEPSLAHTPFLQTSMMLEDDETQTYAAFTNGCGEILDVEDIMHPTIGCDTPFNPWTGPSMPPEDLMVDGSISEARPRHTPSPTRPRTPTVAPSRVVSGAMFSQMSAMSLTDTLVGSPPARANTPTPCARAFGAASGVDERWTDTDSSDDESGTMAMSLPGSRASSPVDIDGWPLPRHTFVPDMRVERRPCNAVPPPSGKERGVRFHMGEPRSPESTGDVSSDEEMETESVA